jgi:tetratricopeptide (TPR) repeat protein
MCLASADDSTPANLERSWRMVIDLWNRLHGPSPARDSVAWHWLGETLAKPPASPFPFPFGDSKVDHRRARKALDQAVDCDPSNEDAWLSLLALLARQRDTKTRNRLLDDLVKRFPRNKTILMEAGARAQDRKAFDKSLGFLEAALALDPLDKTVKRSMLVALVMQTREWLAKGRPAAALWDRMEPLLEDNPGRDFMMLVRWLARVRRSLLDPDPAAAQRVRDDAVLMAPSPIERLFAEHSFAAVYRIQSRPDWDREWKESLAGGQPDWRIFCNLLDLLAFLTQIKEWRWQDNKNAGDRLRDILNVLINSGLKKDPDGLLAFLDHIEIIRKKSTDLAWDAVTSCLEKVAATLDRQAAPGNKKVDPRLRLATLILRDRFGANRFMTSAAFLRDLDSVITLRFQR